MSHDPEHAHDPASAPTPAAGPPPRQTILSQPSCVMATPQVELAVTLLGGHMAPVTFLRDTPHPVQPYHVSPWQEEPVEDLPAPVLVPLRGDFFCLPFGGNAETVDGESHPPHGETAGSRWTHVDTLTRGPVATLTLALETTVRPSRVTKSLSLVDGHNVVYSTHLIEGFAGRAPLGHHATLALPDEAGAARLATSPMRFGMTCPGVFSDPAHGEYQALEPGQKWTSLAAVPRAWKGSPDADLTRLPINPGFADLVQLLNEPAGAGGNPAWVTATVASRGYLWFALKDPAVLNSTILWLENRGRHGRPWFGRNQCVGIEDVTAFFAAGLAASIAENALTREGVPTTVTFDAHTPTAIRYIQGVAAIPRGFDVVKAVTFGPGTVTFVSAAGPSVTVPVAHDYLHAGVDALPKAD